MIAREVHAIIRILQRNLFKKKLMHKENINSINRRGNNCNLRWWRFCGAQIHEPYKSRKCCVRVSWFCHTKHNKIAIRFGNCTLQLPKARLSTWYCSTPKKKTWKKSLNLRNAWFKSIWRNTLVWTAIGTQWKRTNSKPRIIRDESNLLVIRLFNFQVMQTKIIDEITAVAAMDCERQERSHSGTQ